MHSVNLLFVPKPSRTSQITGPSKAFEFSRDMDTPGKAGKACVVVPLDVSAMIASFHVHRVTNLFQSHTILVCFRVGLSGISRHWTEFQTAE